MVAKGGESDAVTYLYNPLVEVEHCGKSCRKRCTEPPFPRGEEEYVKVVAQGKRLGYGDLASCFHVFSKAFGGMISSFTLYIIYAPNEDVCVTHESQFGMQYSRRCNHEQTSFQYVLPGDLHRRGNNIHRYQSDMSKPFIDLMI